MNEIRFSIQHNEFDRLIVPIINGESLISILKDFEKPFAKKEGYLKLAGGYDGIPLNYVKSPKNYYLGLDQDQWLDGKTALLDCHCLCVGCWSFVAKIEVDKNKVIWKDFEQIHRENWNYVGLDKFIFDKAQYEIAIDELNET